MVELSSFVRKYSFKHFVVPINCEWRVREDWEEVFVIVQYVPSVPNSLVWGRPIYIVLGAKRKWSLYSSSFDIPQ